MFLSSGREGNNKGDGGLAASVPFLYEGGKKGDVDEVIFSYCEFIEPRSRYD